MAIIDPVFPVSARFLAPLQRALNRCRSSRQCAVLDDLQWLTLGVQRCLQHSPSGRGFLQSFSAVRPELCPEVNHFFASLKSARRLQMTTEVHELILAEGAAVLPDRLAAFPCLAGFAIYASDLHFHQHACHDARHPDGHFLSIGHLYCRNLRTGLVSHLALAQPAQRKAEHDMKTLKRANLTALRQGAAKGVKVLHVYDRAGIDFAQWQTWKQGSGIYFLSRTKENMALETLGNSPFDLNDSVNAGVLADDLVGPANGAALRRVTYHDLQSGRTFEFLTNLLDTEIPPGVIALLYKKRWDVEKSFDEMKNKLGEDKAWATSATAKQMQAQFICLTLNLVTLLAHQLEAEEGITNLAEAQRQAQRTEAALAVELAAGRPAPPAWQMALAPTQHSVKLYRWITARLWLPVLWNTACAALRSLYAQL